MYAISISSTRLGWTVARAVAAVAIGLVAFLPAAVFADPAPAPPDVPGTIEVADGSSPYLVWHATGTQNYRCDFTGSAYVWTFAGPEANLYDARGKQVGTHFSGPTWRARDGSLVVGTLDGIAEVAGTIPWLRLKAASTSVSPDGGDRLSDTTYIQRIKTTGGLRPVDGCNSASIGTVEKVPYTADYYFYRLDE